MLKSTLKGSMVKKSISQLTGGKKEKTLAGG